MDIVKNDIIKSLKDDTLIDLPLKIKNNIGNTSNVYIISNYICKIFDISKIDTKTYFKKHMEPESILKRTDDELTKDIPQWKYFRRLVEYLVMNGRYVGIASFGTYEIIQAYMQLEFILKTIYNMQLLDLLLNFYHQVENILIKKII